MDLRWGFKAAANWYARDVRRDLGLAPHSPLCPWKLASHMEFPLIPLSAYAGLEPEAVAYFSSTRGQREFSAITVFGAEQTFIVHNDFHHPKRQAANIAHELAHRLLIHPPEPPH